LIIAVVLTFVVLLVVGFMLSRGTARRKKEAIASLEAERNALASVTILDLVIAEVEDLGLRSIDGSEGVAPDVLLRAWKDAGERTKQLDRGRLRFVVADADRSGDLQPGDLRLEERDGSSPTDDPAGSDA
jgi:hypothetical protein